MSFFDKLKNAGNQVKENSTSFASNSAGALWVCHGDEVRKAVVKYASRAAAKGSSFIADDAKYKANVVDPAWEMLPMPVRLLGRERLKWDAIFNSARSKVFVIDGENVTVHPEANQRINQLFAKMLPTEKLQKIEGEVQAAGQNPTFPGACATKRIGPPPLPPPLPTRSKKLN